MITTASQLIVNHTIFFLHFTSCKMPWLNVFFADPSYIFVNNTDKIIGQLLTFYVCFYSIYHKLSWTILCKLHLVMYILFVNSTGVCVAGKSNTAIQTTQLNRHSISSPPPISHCLVAVCIRPLIKGFADGTFSDL